MPRSTRGSGLVGHSAQEMAAATISQEGSWQIPQDDEYNLAEAEMEENQDDESSADDSNSEGDSLEGHSGAPPTEGNGANTMNAQHLLQPLQQTAERVIRQVEDFAKSLDKFNASRSRTDMALWKDAEKLLQKFQSITETRKKAMTSTLGGSRPGSRNRPLTNADEKEAETNQFEADLWGLTASLLNGDSPDNEALTEDARSSALSRLHRYTSDMEIWSVFIASDSFAQHCQDVLDWLQRLAASSRTGIEDVLSPLTQKAQRGTGVWSAGWMYTKLAIKKQKQSRSWNKPLEPSVPEIKLSSHLRSSDAKSLVAQMDPDAMTREGSVLEPQDEFHEQAAWQACWELLRRGQDVDTSRTWWTERKEAWRAAGMRCAGSDMEQHRSSSWTRFANLAHNSEWLKRCEVLSKDGHDLERYQGAVYGVLSGDLTAPRKVCRTLDDHLFVYFNGHLVHRYLDFLRVYQRKVHGANKIEFRPQPATFESLRNFLAYYAQADESTKEDSQSCHKQIEAAIVSKDFVPFLERQGQAVAQLSRSAYPSMYLTVEVANSQVNEAALATAQDPDSVRIIVHLQLLLGALGYLNISHQESLIAMENNIAAYIGWLQSERKLALIPLYASKMSAERAAQAMGMIITEITNAKERDLQVKLMKQYRIHIPNVLDAQWSFTNDDLLESFNSKPMSIANVSVTEYVGTAKRKTIRVNPQFIGDDLTDDDERAVRSLEWYRYADKQHWDQACHAATSLYKVFIAQGKLVAAKALAVRASLSEISTTALGRDMSHGIPSLKVRSEDVDMDKEVDLNDSQHNEPGHNISPSKKRKDSKKSVVHVSDPPNVSVEVLAAKAQTWRELEQLVVVLDVLEVWSECAEGLENHRNATREEIKALKKVLNESLNEVHENMSPLLEEDYLSQPMDESESDCLHQIRTYYLPEIMLAYNSVLYFAGHAISRSWLVECMNLAQVVATNPTLTNAFVESGRMRELVTAFAQSSQALLRANEAGGKKGKRDAGIDIWQVDFDEGPSH